MSRIEPNLLLAITTGIALILLVVTATAFGEPGPAWRYPLMALVGSALFVVLQRPLERWMKRPPRPPMIHAESPATAVWASIFPAIVILMAGAPVLFPGFDYGLLVIIASVFFGQTVDSVLRARRLA